MTRRTSLVSTFGRSIALQSIHIEGQVDGLMAEMAITLHFRNESGNKHEIAYTFPLAAGGVLLGMEVSLGGRRLHGFIAEKKGTWKHYEEAIDGGDAPVLVEQSSPGLFTANLGNINAGEDVIVELRYAQLLSFNDGSLRLTIPSAIAWHYSNKHRPKGIAGFGHGTGPYPLTLRVLVRGQLAKATIHSVSHRCSLEETLDGLVVSLDSWVKLDRDFMLCLDDLGQYPCALVGADSNHFLMLAGFCPGPSSGKPQPLHLKILVDCSGSMWGDSIEQVRRVLFSLSRLLELGDYFSYSRFGSTVRHETKGFLAYSPEAKGQLYRAFGRPNVTMGGKEMAHALLSTLDNIAMPEGAQTSPCVLLITNGALWSVDNVIRTCRASGQRIFVIGVGNGPAESLRELAQNTGGAYIPVPHHKIITPKLKIMFDRMREPAYESPFIDWGDEPVWQTALPFRLYRGQGAHVFASFSKLPMSAPTIHWRTEDEEHALSVENPLIAQSTALARLAGASRLAAAGTQKEARELALQYRLVSEHTSLFLAHEREGGELNELSMLHRVPQMRESRRDKAARENCKFFTYSAPVIKVIGIGGGGSSAVGHMISSGLKGVSFIAANSYSQALVRPRADKTIQLEYEYLAGENGLKRGGGRGESCVC